MQDNWTFNLVAGMVRTEEQRLANIVAMGDGGNQSTPDPQGPQAHFAKVNGGNGGNSGKKGKFTGKCFYCDVIGHMVSQCPKLVEDKKREKQKSSDAFGGYAYAFVAYSDRRTPAISAISTSSDGRAISAAFSDVQGVHGAHSDVQGAHGAHSDVQGAQGAHSDVQGAQGAHASALSAASTDSDAGILDTGASHFMHPNKGLFVEYQELKAPILVDGIAGNRSAVGAGLMRIVDDRGNVAYLENALHVPGLPSGLFSLNRALIDKNWDDVPPVIHKAHQAGSHS